MTEQTLEELPAQEMGMSLWLLCNTTSTKPFNFTETELKDLLALKDTTKEHSEEGI